MRFERFHDHRETSLERGRVDDDQECVGLGVELAREHLLDDLLVGGFAAQAVAPG